MSIRQKRKKMLRWERWENKILKLVGPELLATPGAMRAYNAYAHQWNAKQNRVEVQ